MGDQSPPHPANRRNDLADPELLGPLCREENLFIHAEINEFSLCINHYAYDCIMTPFNDTDRAKMHGR
jgi:hypothetical protein